jgi:hypothetical protein
MACMRHRRASTVLLEFSVQSSTALSRLWVVTQVPDLNSSEAGKGQEVNTRDYNKSTKQGSNGGPLTKGHLIELGNRNRFTAAPLAQANSVKQWSVSPREDGSPQSLHEQQRSRAEPATLALKHSNTQFTSGTSEE